MELILNLKEQLECEIVHIRETLSAKCMSLANDMTRLSNKLKGDTPADRIHVNSLGEIQYKSVSIDTECARLAATIEFLGQLKQDEEGN